MFYERPLLKAGRLATIAATHVPASLPSFPAREMASKLFMSHRIARLVGVSRRRVHFVHHHEAHAASAYLCSPFPDAAVLTVDGVGEWATAMIANGFGETLFPIYQVDYPHSIGLLYSTLTSWLGFAVNDGEYKVMGLAAYGRPRYCDRVEQLVTCGTSGRFSLNMEYFRFHVDDRCMWSVAFEDLFGQPRSVGEDFNVPLTRRQQYFSDVAASLQQVVGDLVVRLAQQAERRVQSSNLCLAGGVALNGVINTRIQRETGFTQVWVQPAAGDAGGALGAALIGALECGDGRARFTTPYLGEAYCADTMVDAVAQTGLICASPTCLHNEIADELDHGKVVGWCAGRDEWGPRALGNRSILADPRHSAMRDRVNASVKYREPFRPFAPSVLAADAAAYVAMPSTQPARYMLQVSESLQPHVVPAVTHVDGTTRPHVVYADDNPSFEYLLFLAKQRLGVPLLMNTSFNLRGEPMVSSPADAVRTFMASDIDTLVYDSVVVRKP